MEELAKIAREERLPVVPADETGRAMAHIMKGLSISKLSDLQDID
jgi:hypothetical protein